MHFKSQRSFVSPAQRKIVQLAPLTQKKSWSYKPISKLGEGSFGTVSSAVDVDGTPVAVKRVIIDPNFKNREVEINEILNSPYCVKMRNHYKVTKKDGTVVQFIVMESMPTSLGKFLSQKSYQDFLTAQQVKHIASQLFKGLDYLHSLNICHRDIKPDNILLNPQNFSIKYCDFGSAKVIQKGDRNSPSIGSRYYRAPEVLLGSRTYDHAIDIWSVGCVIAQMLMNNAVPFAGNDDDDQLREIMKVLGQPSEEDAASFEHEKPFPCVQQTSDLKHLLPPNTDPKILDLLSSIFQYNPSKRPTAAQCLKHKYFSTSLYSRLPVLKPNKA